MSRGFRYVRAGEELAVRITVDLPGAAKLVSAGLELQNHLSVDGRVTCRHARQNRFIAICVCRDIVQAVIYCRSLEYPGVGGVSSVPTAERTTCYSPR